MKLTLSTVLPFGKYKGKLINDLIPEPSTTLEARELRQIVRYFGWIKKETSYELSEEVVDRIKTILKMSAKISSDIPSYSKSYLGRYSKKGRLEHWNDMGAMNDISFQDCYGDFGY